MGKQELMENYTMDQLTDRIIILEIKLKEKETTAEILKKLNSDRISECRNEIINLKEELNRKQTEINQIDEILNELFGVTHDIVKTPDEFKEILSKKKKETNKSGNRHEIRFKINCGVISVYIDKNRINPIGFYPLNEYGKRLSEEEMEDLEPDCIVNCAELEVRCIEDIALTMNEETFTQFCELWREIHDSEGNKDGQ